MTARDNKELYEGLGPADLFTFFTEKAWDVPDITGSFQLLKEKLEIHQEEHGLALYASLKSKLTHWKAKTLWELLDKKVQLSDYKQQKSCNGMKVCVVGCGPVGMRFAIEAALLGCDVFVVDKRSYFSRNNVLHLWPFTIDDLRRLGAKKFYGQFCAGSIDHISIRSLQSVLLKTSLILGIKIYFNVEFIKIKEPFGGRSWHAEFTPSSHILNEMDFKVLVGAEGKNSRIPGFDRKELRAKLALAITANFINHRTQEEAAIQEISGVAFIFNQKFFKDLKADTGIDLENIVYYKDDTHYFIMTAKKDSLLEKGVLIKDYSDVQQLLAPSNRNAKAMYDYACEAAGWSTELPHLDFAVNHKGQPDVDLFDFTSIYQAEYAAKAIRRENEDLLLCLVGDSLVQPFWPQGTGCARGFLSAMDAAWLVKGFGEGQSVLNLLAERESLFQRLTQTKPENLVKKFSSYTIDPRTRYPNLNIHIVKPDMVKHLYDFDGELPLEIQIERSANTIQLKENAQPLEAVPSDNIPSSVSSNVSPVKTNEPRPKPLLRTPSRSINEAGHVTRALYGTPEEVTTLVDKQVLLQWFQKEMKDYSFLRVNDLVRSFRDGLVLCTLIYRYDPSLLPQFTDLTSSDPLANNRLAFSILDKHYNIPQLIKPSEMAKPDRLALFTYLSSVYETFQDLELPPKTEAAMPSDIKKNKLTRRLSRKSSKGLLQAASPTESWNTHTSSLRRSLSPLKSSKREKANKKLDDGTASLTGIKEESTSVTSLNESNSQKVTPRQSVATSKQNVTPRQAASATPSLKKGEQSTSKESSSVNSVSPAKKSGARPVSTFGSPTSTSDICFFCDKKVYLMERMSANGVFFHRHCFRCSHCNMQLNLGNFAMSKNESGAQGKFFCKPHYRQLFMSNPEAINYARSQPDKHVTTPPTSPVKKNLQTIEEDEPAKSPPTPPLIVESENEEQVERKRTLTQRFSDYWRRRSRSHSKSASPEKTIAPKKDDETEVQPTPRPTPVSPPPTSPQLIVSSYDDETPFRDRSPPVLVGRPGTTPPPRADGSVLSTVTPKKGRGQTSIVRPLFAVDENNEIALAERQKQQERFREAQAIQREMSQIELQYDELEDIAREIEQNLRDAEGTNQEDSFMKAWLNLVSERNSLVRRTTDLSMQMKILELEDRQCEIEKEMRELQDNFDETSDVSFEKLLQELVDVVHERDTIIQQVDIDRLREIEEEEAQTEMMSYHFGDDSPSKSRRNSTKSEGATAEFKKSKKDKEKRTSWWPW